MADLGKQVSQMSAAVLKLNSLQQSTSVAANLPQQSASATQQKPSQGLSGYKIPNTMSSPDDDDEDDDEEDDDDDEDDDSEGGAMMMTMMIMRMFLTTGPLRGHYTNSNSSCRVGPLHLHL